MVAITIDAIDVISKFIYFHVTNNITAIKYVEYSDNDTKNTNF